MALACIHRKAGMSATLQSEQHRKGSGVGEQADRLTGYATVGPQARPLFPQLLRKALELVRGCDCRSLSGCPACVQHLGCTEYNAVLHKRAAIAVLELTLSAEAEYAERLRLQVQRSSSLPHSFPEASAHFQSHLSWPSSALDACLCEICTIRHASLSKEAQC